MARVRTGNAFDINLANGRVYKVKETNTGQKKRERRQGAPSKKAT